MLLLVAPLGARAQSSTNLSPDQVRRYEGHLKKAAEYFGAEDYTAARGELESAYTLYPNPTIIFSLAGTYRREDRLEKALSEYQRFLDECSDACRSENGEQVRVAELTISELEKELAAAPPPPPPKKVERDGSATVLRWTGIGVASVGLVVLGTGGYFQLRASGIEDEIADTLDSNGGMWTNALSAKESDGKTMEKRARIALIAGGGSLLLGAGLYLYAVSRDGDDQRDDVSLLPTISDDGVGLTFVSGF